MQITANTARRPLLYAMLVVAAVGATPFLGPACGRFTVTDEATGQQRPATEDEVKWILAQPTQLVKDIAVATGHPEWLPFADIGMRLAVLIYAIRFGRPLQPKTQAAPVQES